MADVQNTVSEFLRGAADRAQDPRFEQLFADRVRSFNVEELKELRRQIEGTPRGTDPVPYVPEVFRIEKKAMILDITNSRLRSLQESFTGDAGRKLMAIPDAFVDVSNTIVSTVSDKYLGTNIGKSLETSTRGEKRKMGIVTVPIVGAVAIGTLYLGGKLMKKIGNWLFDHGEDLKAKGTAAANRTRSGLGYIWDKITSKPMKITATLLLLAGGGFLFFKDSIVEYLIEHGLEEYARKISDNVDAIKAKINEKKEAAKEKAKEEAANAALVACEATLKATNRALFSTMKNTYAGALNSASKPFIDLGNQAKIKALLVSNGFADVGGNMEKEVTGLGGAKFIITYNIAGKTFELREVVSVGPTFAPIEFTSMGLISWSVSDLNKMNTSIGWNGPKVALGTVIGWNGPKVALGTVKTLLRDVHIIRNIPYRDLKLIAGAHNPDEVRTLASVATLNDREAAALCFVAKSVHEQLSDPRFRLMLGKKIQHKDASGNLVNTDITNPFPEEVTLEEILDEHSFFLNVFGRGQFRDPLKVDRSSALSVNDALARSFVQTNFFSEDLRSPHLHRVLFSLEPSGKINNANVGTFTECCKNIADRSLKNYNVAGYLGSILEPDRSIFDKAFSQLKVSLTDKKSFLLKCIEMHPRDNNSWNDPTVIDRSRANLEEQLDDISILDALQLYLCLQECSIGGAIPTSPQDAQNAGYIAITFKILELLGRKNQADAFQIFIKKTEA
jgi:hypothetical protein